MNPSLQTTTLLPPPNAEQNNVLRGTGTRKVIEEKTFTFDNSFWSHSTSDSHYAHQEDVYNSLGEEFLDHNFEGYHTCIFAYGQTGSGKSYTMMGTPEQPGLIPRTCEDLFQRIESNESPNVSYTVRVSYFEVYNEHVRDLLVPRQDPPFYLKIRESPTEGPYVKDLTDVPVKSLNEIMRFMKMGDASRTTASTKMNDTSSRSHAVFTIMLKQIHHDMDTDETTERMARIRLVDLAGSERAKATEARGQRLREGSNINKSLTTLGRVIAALSSSDATSSAHTPRGHRGGTPSGSSNTSPRKPGSIPKEIVPYRDSILTWLLKDSLGGNSKTAMIACISPCDYDETLSTLRYADQAKRIRTRAIVNQDHVSAAERDAQIAEMQDTIRKLQLSISQTTTQQQMAVSVATTTLKEHEAQTGMQLEEYQKQVDRMQRLMQETRQVSECKIRGLQMENEALRLHLKLAVESLRNPIPVVVPVTKDEDGDGDVLEMDEDGEEQDGVDRRDFATDDNDDENMYASKANSNRKISTSTIAASIIVEDDEEEKDPKPNEARKRKVLGSLSGNANGNARINAHHHHEEETRNQLDDLLKDLNLFRRKIKDDHDRFGPKVQGGTPLMS
ncbi:MAG: hypothetical protein M1823_005530 [Watsoniomyces obsoletus]|nr:MAG: hypothetical protein M1823_005530 [Watsoniomyces obsoletus]